MSNLCMTVHKIFCNGMCDIQSVNLYLQWMILKSVLVRLFIYTLFALFSAQRNRIVFLLFYLPFLINDLDNAPHLYQSLWCRLSLGFIMWTSVTPSQLTAGSCCARP